MELRTCVNYHVGAGTKPRPSRRAVSSLDYRVLSLASLLLLIRRMELTKVSGALIVRLGRGLEGPPESRVNFVACNLCDCMVSELLSLLLC